MFPPAEPLSKIFLADDQIAIRDLLKVYLAQKMPSFEIVGEAASGREALAGMGQFQPGILVADVCFADLSPAEFLEECRSRFASVKIVAFCRWSQVVMARKLIGGGVSGLVAKDDPLEFLQRALSAVAAGGYYLAPSVEAALCREREAGERLTDREWLVLRLIAEGCPTKEVGATLEISTKTAEKYRERIMRKLHLHDVVSLTHYAIRNGVAAL